LICPARISAGPRQASGYSRSTMRSNKKAPDTTNREVTTFRSSPARDRLKDPSSLKADGLRKKLGNDAMGKKVDETAATRDELLQFICARLKVVHTVQSTERQEIGDVRDWYRQVAAGKPGFTLPDPTRWHQTAGIYKRAGIALADGDLGRGASLIEKALESERAAFESVPKQVQDSLDEGDHIAKPERRAATAPDILAYVPSNAGCAVMERPRDLAYADLILNVTAEMQESPPMPTPLWWDEGNKAKDEDAKKGDDKDAKKAEGKGAEKVDAKDAELQKKGPEAIAAKVQAGLAALAPPTKAGPTQAEAKKLTPVVEAAPAAAKEAGVVKEDEGKKPKLPHVVKTAKPEDTKGPKGTKGGTKA
jgi:hypothetical protein